MNENLVQGTIRELRRARELLTFYNAIPTGAFGARTIQQAIDQAERAMGEGDVVQMLRAYGELKSLR